jgi:hypothetical protein
VREVTLCIDSKVLLPKEAFAEVQQVVSDARQKHYFMTPL